MIGVSVVERAIDAGAVLHGLGSALDPLRAPLALALLLWLGVTARRSEARSAVAPVVIALGLGWIAQSTLLDGRIAIGLALYAVAAAAYGWWQPLASDRPWRLPLGLEIAGVIGVIAIGLGAWLIQLDVYPQLYYDEIAYLKAAQMQLGELERGTIFSFEGRPVYSFAQFQSQTVPFLLQSAAVHALGPGVVPLRLVSVTAAALALAVAMAMLRRHLGAPAVLCMGAMCAAAPLFLVYSRAGLYIAISTLHGVVCVAAILWLSERWTRGAAVLLGVLLGGSLYFYQLSWFVPVLALCVLAVSAEHRGRPGAMRILGAVGISALLIALPGAIVLRAGLRDVSAQTFDRAVWNEIDERRTRAALLIPAAGVEPTRVAGFASRFRSASLEVRVDESVRSQPVVVVEGESALAEQAMAAAAAAGWRVLDDPFVLDTLWERVPAMLSRLFATPSPESAGRWVSVPLLNPIVAPLLVLGLLAARRRWREWPMRVLIVWVLGGALLPAAIGGVLPRRAVLMLPFAYAIAALPLLEVVAAFGRRGVAPRIAAAICTAVLVAAVALTDGFLYFRNWDERIADHPGAPQILEFVQLLHELPEGETILMPSMFKAYQMVLVRGRGLRAAATVVEEPRADSREGIRAASCRQQTPFTWVIADSPSERELFQVLDEDFLYRIEERGKFRLLRVGVRKRNGCPTPLAAAATGRVGVLAAGARHSASMSPVRS